jgi:phosphosulfolactate synthase
MRQVIPIRPDFLQLPTRTGKPRGSGLTHVLDKGAPLAQVEPFVELAADRIDLWKLGWGTAYLEADVAEKVELLGRFGIRACVGGTLLEAAWLQGQSGSCLSWAEQVGFPCVEVSNGAVAMPIAEKRRLIASAAERFVTVAEVGSKDPSVTASPRSWAEEIEGDLEAGASWVLTEGRESGTVGLYTAEGEVREDVVEAVAGAVSPERVIFEAPQKHQQAWLIRRFGPDVNLGNVRLDEVLGLEALRLGLRADTIGPAPGDARRAASP